VLTVEKNVKFLSNLMEQDQYIVENVMLREDPQEDHIEDIRNICKILIIINR
jgi:hypothetical protein